MLRSTLGCAIVAALVAFASPAAASDMTFRKADATGLTDTVIGQPYWLLHAQCAGLFGARSQWELDAGRRDKAEEAKVQAVEFMHAALKRLQTDRGLDRKQALALAIPHLEAGRNHGKEILANGRTGWQSAWNAERSFCLDVRDAYRRRS
jgi:hypothetical protein